MAVDRAAAAAPRLLIVVNDAAFFLSHRLAVARAAADAGFDVHLATPYTPVENDIRATGFPWHPIALHRSRRAPVRELASIVRLARLYARIRPDIVHHVTPKPVLYGTVAAQVARVPAVVNAISGMGHVFAHDGGFAHRLMRTAVSVGYRIAMRHRRMRVIFQNTDARSDFIERGWIRSDEAVLIRGSGVDIAEFSAGPRGATSTPVVALVARMLMTKGVLEFVRAAEILRDDGVTARFVLVGSPDPGNPASVSASWLRDSVQSGAIEYWGHRDDIPSVLRETDIACLPSYLEGLPKSLIEAAAAGLPIVTTDVPGCREVVAEGVNGFLVPSRNAEALAAALRRLIESPSLRASFGAASRRRAEAEFTLRQVCEAHIELYRSLLA